MTRPPDHQHAMTIAAAASPELPEVVAGLPVLIRIPDLGTVSTSAASQGVGACPAQREAAAEGAQPTTSGLLWKELVLRYGGQLPSQAADWIQKLAYWLWKTPPTSDKTVQGERSDHQSPAGSFPQTAVSEDRPSVLSQLKRPQILGPVLAASVLVALGVGVAVVGQDPDQNVAETVSPSENNSQTPTLVREVRELRSEQSRVDASEPVPPSPSAPDELGRSQPSQLQQSADTVSPSRGMDSGSAQPEPPGRFLALPANTLRPAQPGVARLTGVYLTGRGANGPSSTRVPETVSQRLPQSRPAQPPAGGFPATLRSGGRPGFPPGGPTGQPNLVPPDFGQPFAR